MTLLTRGATISGELVVPVLVGDGAVKYHTTSTYAAQDSVPDELMVRLLRQEEAAAELGWKEGQGLAGDGWLDAAGDCHVYLTHRLSAFQSKIWDLAVNYQIHSAAIRQK